MLVTGLSGAGKISILRMLEDLGFETMDNPPLDTLEDLALQAKGNLAVGVDARSRGFAADTVLRKLQLLRENPCLAPTLVFAAASDEVLLRRYSETRRRHPLAQTGTVADGIRLERELTLPLAHGADVLIDTSQLPLPRLRAIIEQNFGADAPGLAVALISFAYPAGLPREADLVFDARFLRNPYYDPSLRPLCGRDPEVGRFIEDDPDFSTYFSKIARTGKIFIAALRAGRKKICNNLYRMYRRATQICIYDREIGCLSKRSGMAGRRYPPRGRKIRVRSKRPDHGRQGMIFST